MVEISTTTGKVSVERIDFDVHANIIRDLIHSQNGTVATALRELIMNAIDAGSKKCEVKLHRKGFSVIDWGNGFESEAAIKTYFKNFGEPHEEGDAEFGRFRIGRGQVMAFGKITWTSNYFAMAVDTRKNGFSFDFMSHRDLQWDGCRVDGTFYNELREREVYHIKEELQEFICFADIDVSFNGESLNSNIDNESWDVDDGDILIQWKSGNGIKIYSKGVFVKRIDAYRYGFEGRVVTRKALKLNMARNEVTDNDPLWERIAEHLSNRSRVIAKRKGKGGRIDAATRRSMIRLFLSGSLPSEDVLNFCMLKDCRGHSISVTNIVNSNLKLTISPEFGSRKAQSVATRRMAQVLDHDVLDEFGAGSLEGLIDKVIMILRENYSEKNYCVSRYMSLLYDKPIIDFKTVSSRLISDSLIHPRSKYTMREAAARNALQHGSNLMARDLSKILDRDINRRNIMLGVSDVADGWTNGSDTIVVAKHMLPYLDTLSRAGGFQMALLLLHEYLHDEDDSGSHQHDFEFMSLFHDIASSCRNDVLGCVGLGMYTRYLRELSKKNLDLPKKIKGEFAYPVINDVYRYVLTTKAKTITPVTKTVLGWLGLPYKKEKGNIVITVSRDDPLHCEFHFHFYRVVKRHGSDIKSFEHYQVLCGDYNSALKAFKNAVAGALELLAGFNDIEMGFFSKLADSSSIEDALAALCSAEVTGIKFITKDHYGEIRNTFNDKVDYTHAINNPFPNQSWGDNRSLQTHQSHADFSASKSKRLQYAKQIIEHAFMGLKDESERLELADILLNNKGKEEILSVAEIL